MPIFVFRMDSKNYFINHLAQTSPFPIGIEVQSAEGNWITDTSGKRYLDFISGVGVTNMGHRHPKVVEAIHAQAEKYLHVMVYGEFIQQPLHDLAAELQHILPKNINNYYFVNSGAEATEAALKLAKRVTGRSELVAMKGAYHGNTHGALSVSANEKKKYRFRPLLPDVRFLKYNSIPDLDQITERTAGVILESVQGDAGVIVPSNEYMQALATKCKSVGALLMVDEIQCGMGRTGKPFAFSHFGIEPDVVIMGKALGGGLPIGAIAAPKKHMELFSHDPILGHITTFGGNPLICASAAAFLKAMRTEIDWNEVEEKSELIAQFLNHEAISEVRKIGLMFAADLQSFDEVKWLFDFCLERGLITFWFLSTDYAFRLAPPLTVTKEEIEWTGKIIREGLDQILSRRK